MVCQRLWAFTMCNVNGVLENRHTSDSSNGQCYLLVLLEGHFYWVWTFRLAGGELSPDMPHPGCDITESNERIITL